MRRKYEMWLIPVFMVIAILAAWLILNALPSTIFGTEWTSIKNELWIYLPYLVPFAFGLYVLELLTRRRR